MDACSFKCVLSEIIDINIDLTKRLSLIDKWNFYQGLLETRTQMNTDMTSMICSYCSVSAGCLIGQLDANVLSITI